MSKKIEPIQYIDEDCLFLALKLLNYPKMERDKFTFSEIKMEKYKHATAFKIFQNIANFNKQGLLKIEELKFSLLNTSADDQTVKTLIQLTRIKFPKHDLSLATRRIMDNNFNLCDLELISSHEYGNYVLRFIDFDIKINQELRQKFIGRLKGYLKLFADGKLESSTENYFRIELQRKSIEEKIDEISGKTGSTLALRDSDFSGDFRFFESILLLEKEKKLTIKNISSKETCKNSFSYIIHCELKGKCNSRPPFYIIKKGMGFLKFSKNGRTIKIGKTDSQHFRLLKLLLKDFERENRIDYVFEKIETKRIKKYPDLDPDDQMRKLEYVVKELQKNKRLGGRLKITLNKRGRTIRIDYTK